MKKYSVLIVLVILITLLWLFRTKLPFISGSSQSKVNIVTTSSDLAVMAKKVGGDYVTVQTLFPEPQSALQEPTEKQKESIHHTDIFIYKGGEIHDWADTFGSELAKQGIVVIKYKPAALAGQSEKELSRVTADRLARVLEILDIPHAQSFAQNAQTYIATQQ